MKLTKKRTNSVLKAAIRFFFSFSFLFFVLCFSAFLSIDFARLVLVSYSSLELLSLASQTSQRKISFWVSGIVRSYEVK